MENTDVITDTIQDAEVKPETATETEATPKAEAKGTGTDSFTVRFNHEDRVLSRDEAVGFAQKGMKFDTLAPMLDDLNMLAAMRDSDAHELIKSLIEADESAKREELENRYGDDEEVIEMLMTKYRDSNASKFKKMQTDREEAAKAMVRERVQTVEARIAEGFAEVQEDFPEYTDVTKLPKEVLADVKNNGRDLYDAVLRFRRAEEKRVLAEKENAAKNAQNATGKVDSGEVEDPLLLAFMKNFK